MPAKVKSKRNRKSKKKTTKVTAPVVVESVAPPASEPVQVQTDTPVVAVSTAPQTRTEAECLQELDNEFNTNYQQLKELLSATKLVMADARRLHRLSKREVRDSGKRRRRRKTQEPTVSI